jgi:hypothetical protein
MGLSEFHGTLRKIILHFGGDFGYINFSFEVPLIRRCRYLFPWHSRQSLLDNFLNILKFFFLVVACDFTKLRIGAMKANGGEEKKINGGSVTAD